MLKGIKQLQKILKEDTQSITKELKNNDITKIDYVISLIDFHESTLKHLIEIKEHYNKFGK